MKIGMKKKRTSLILLITMMVCFGMISATTHGTTSGTGTTTTTAHGADTKTETIDLKHIVEKIPEIKIIELKT